MFSKNEYFIKYEKFTQPWKNTKTHEYKKEPTLKQDPFLRKSDATGFNFHVETKTCIKDGWTAQEAWENVTQEEHEFNGLRLIDIKKL
jgi:hypothetical protein